MKVTATVVAFVLVAATLVLAQEAKLPVLYLRYSGGVGAEEPEEDVGLEPVPCGTR